MEPLEDLIVEISESRQKFFGCSGRMLVPCRATVESLIAEIPENQVVTTEILRKELAKRHNVEVTCPAATKTILESIANDVQTSSPYWRVIKKNGGLLAGFPGGADGQAALLGKEGFSFDTSGKSPRVRGFQKRLAHFG